MSSTVDYIEYVCDQLRDLGEVRYRKMFGEYMVYIDDRPIVIVCDNTPFVKMLDCIAPHMQNAKTGFPYQGAKEHYILNLDDRDFCQKVVAAIAAVTPLPKQRRPASLKSER